MTLPTFLRRLVDMRLPVLVATVLALLAALLTAPAHAVIGAADNVPAATLLLPYFEADLNNNNGVQTSIRVSNASASAGMLNVTLWSDWGIPTKSFGIYMTGYDTTEIDLRLLFKGHLPRTADAGSDPTNKISPKGSWSQDINFPGNGPAATPYTTLLSPTAIQNLAAAHTGLASGTFGGLCGSKAYGDGIARGYVTIDDANVGSEIDEMNPSTADYFDGSHAGNRNIWVGSYTMTNRNQRFVTTDAMVHIESSSFPGPAITAGNPTFYSRFNGVTNNIDLREPLSSVWDMRYLNGGGFTGGTRAVVWRDPVVNPAPVACGGGLPTGFPFTMREIVAWDEQETIAYSPNSGGEPVAGSASAFPIVTQSVPTGPLSPFQFGVLRLNFNDPGATAPFAGSRQAYISAFHSKSGAYAVSVPGVVISPQSATPGQFANRIGN
ncbi:MAG: hypothetical protein V4805_16325 [Pseudomonadota bacterium]